VFKLTLEKAIPKYQIFPFAEHQHDIWPGSASTAAVQAWKNFSGA
jgi:hypothetical protein